MKEIKFRIWDEETKESYTPDEKIKEIFN